MTDAALERYGHIDVLYNNAAILDSVRDTVLHEMALENWEYILGINLRGPFLCSKHVIPSMLKQGGGSIILTRLAHRTHRVRAKAHGLQRGAKAASRP